MGYFKRLRTTIHGKLATELEKEKQKRGNYRGCEAEIVREALREKFKTAV